MFVPLKASIMVQDCAREGPCPEEARMRLPCFQVLQGYKPTIQNCKCSSFPQSLRIRISDLHWHKCALLGIVLRCHRGCRMSFQLRLPEISPSALASWRPRGYQVSPEALPGATLCWLCRPGLSCTAELSQTQEPKRWERRTMRLPPDRGFQT